MKSTPFIFLALAVGCGGAATEQSDPAPASPVTTGSEVVEDVVDTTLAELSADPEADVPLAELLVRTREDTMGTEDATAERFLVASTGAMRELAIVTTPMEGGASTMAFAWNGSAWVHAWGVLLPNRYTITNLRTVEAEARQYVVADYVFESQSPHSDAVATGYLLCGVRDLTEGASARCGEIISTVRESSAAPMPDASVTIGDGVVSVSHSETETPIDGFEQVGYDGQLPVGEHSFEQVLPVFAYASVGG